MSEENIAVRDAWLYGEDTGRFYHFQYLKTPMGYLNQVEPVHGGWVYRGFNMDLADTISLAGFKLIHGWCDYSYRMVWVSYQWQAIFTYCEGDLTLETFYSREAFIMAVAEAREYYEDGGQ